MRYAHEEIVTTALDLVGRDGSAGLNLRALAAELDLSAMALYRYFGGKNELLDAMIAQALAPVADGDDDLRSAMVRMHAILVANPGLAELCALRFPGAQLDALRDRLHALSPDAQRLRALTSYTLGAALVATGRTVHESFEYGLDLLLEGT